MSEKPPDKEFWKMLIVPENFTIDSIARVMDLFNDLEDAGEHYGVRFPTAVFYRENQDDGLA